VIANSGNDCLISNVVWFVSIKEILLVSQLLIIVILKKKKTKQTLQITDGKLTWNYSVYL